MPRPLSWPLFWFLAALSAGVLYLAVLRPTFPPGSDVWDYSQEARQIAGGHGFTSLYTYPVHLTLEGPPFPVLWRMPLYAVLGATLLRAGVDLPFGFLLIGILAHAAIVLLVFLIARSLLSGLAGCVSAAVLLVSPLLLDPYDPGLSQVPAAALATLTWYLLLCRRGRVVAVTAAVSAAAAWYLRGEAALMVPLWVGAALFAGAGAARPAGASGPSELHTAAAGRTVSWSRAGWFVAVFIGLAAPWILRSMVTDGGAVPIRGNPTLLYTPEFPGYSSARGIGEQLPTVSGYVLGHWSTFLVRFLKDVVGYVVDLLAAVGIIGVGLLVARWLDSQLHRPSNASQSSGKVGLSRLAMGLLGAAIAVQIGAMSALERSPRFLVAAFPAACILLGLVVALYLDRLRSPRTILAVLLLLVGERGVALAFDRSDAARRFPPIPSQVVRELRPVASSWHHEALVLTDVPDWVAWQLERPALLLPLWKYLPELVASREVSAIYLSTAASDRNAADHDKGWIGVMDRCGSIPGFDGPLVLGDGSHLYVRKSVARAALGSDG